MKIKAEEKPEEKIWKSQWPPTHPILGRNEEKILKSSEKEDGEKGKMKRRKMEGWRKR